MARVLATDPDIEVVGEAAGGLEALEKIRDCRPDVVTLDVDMPQLDGLATLRELKQAQPDLPVIMMSAHTQDGAETTLQALADGAVDFIDKTSFNVMDFAGLSREVLDKIKIWDPRGPADGSRSMRPREAEPGEEGGAEGKPGPPPVCWNRYKTCIIGASTGGPLALESLLRSIPGDFPVSIVIVQHMPQGFTRPFADRLDSISELSVSEATHGRRLAPGTAVVAPAGQHLRVNDNMRVFLSEEPAGAIHRPSVDVTMYSAACTHRPGTVAGVLLTGMGADGAEGMYAIREKNGLTVAENEKSCIVPGMPRAAYLRGAVAHYLSLDEIVSMFLSRGRTGKS
jgi:two-component system chemotaxis response regulator CheB